MRDNGKAVHRLVRIAAMTAILETAKFALNAVANVELVTLLVILFTERFGQRETLSAVLLFALLESMWWGVNIWTITYFYVWPILVFISVPLAKEPSVLLKSIAAGIFGLLFGLLCSLTTLVISGPQAAFAWWAAGIPFDLIHALSNFLLCLVLYRPLSNVLNHLHPAKAGS